MAAAVARPSPDRSGWSLPSIERGAAPPASSSHPPGGDQRSGGARPQPKASKSGGKSGGTAKSKSGRSRRDKSGTTSDNRWTASEIAAYFGFDSSRTPSLSSASSVFPSSRYGESYASKSAGSRTTSCKSYMTGLMLDSQPDNAARHAESRATHVLNTARSAWTTVHYQYEPDYEEKKARVLRGKFRRELSEYFPDLKRTKQRVRYQINHESEDDLYDTDLDPELGMELLATERARMSTDPAGNPEYRRLCRKYNVVPNSFFLRHLHDEQLDLNYRYLSFGDAFTLAKEIENQPSITSLNVEDNAIGPTGMLCFADMLMKNSYIHQVNLKDNGLGVLGARLLKKVLLKNARLVTVDVSGNNFGERGARFLADVIDRNDTIRHLYLSHNAIGDAGASLIGKALGNNTTLKTLDLSWNHIRKKGAFGFSKGIKVNTTLETLNVSMNGLHVEGVRLLMAGLRGNESLRDLDLSANRLDAEAAKLVARTLPHLMALTALRVAFNPIGTEGAEAIVKALMNCPFSAMEYVDLEGVSLEDHFALLAAELGSQRGDALRLAFHVPPCTRHPTTVLPADALAQVADLLDDHEADLRDLYKDVPDDDQLILSTEDVFTKIQKSGKVDLARLSGLKRAVHGSLRQRFLLRDLLQVGAQRRAAHLAGLKTGRGLGSAHTDHADHAPSPDAWRFPRPASSHHSLDTPDPPPSDH